MRGPSEVLTKRSFTFRVRGPHCSLSQAQGGRDVTGVTPHASTRGRCPARDGSERTSLDYYAAPLAEHESRMG